jgi:CubicO group peptidase (beta-lactamase class C family)
VAALLIAGCQSNPTKVENTRAVNLAGIDARVTALMATANVPGLTLAVIEGGTVVYSKVYGMADVDKRTPLTTDTVMYGASLTKGIKGARLDMFCENWTFRTVLVLSKMVDH